MHVMALLTIYCHPRVFDVHLSRFFSVCSEFHAFITMSNVNMCSHAATSAVKDLCDLIVLSGNIITSDCDKLISN